VPCEQYRVALTNVLGIVQYSTSGFSGISRIVETSERPQPRLGWFDERVLRSKARVFCPSRARQFLPEFRRTDSPKAEASVLNVNDNLLTKVVCNLLTFGPSGRGECFKMCKFYARRWLTGREKANRGRPKLSQKGSQAPDKSGETIGREAT
jgi:hypothetical protein